MRLLYFAPHQLWPVVTGARLRDYHLARGLAARCAVTFLETRQPGEANDPPAPPCGFERVVTVVKDKSYGLSNILRGLAGPVPLTVLNAASSLARKNPLASIAAYRQAFDGDPALSRDGCELFFQSNRGNSHDLYRSTVTPQ